MTPAPPVQPTTEQPPQQPQPPPQHRRQKALAQLQRRIRRRRARITAQRQALAIRHFADFVRLFWPIAVPQAKRCVWAPHMQVICQELEALFTESTRRRALQAAILSESATPEEAAERIEAELGCLPPLRLVINVPPRHSKSALIAKLFPAWVWLNRPQEQFIALAASDDLVERDGIALRSVVSHPTYQALADRVRAAADLSPWRLRADQNAKKKFDTTEGGCRQGFPIDGRYTGPDADCILIDDPIDVDEAFEGTAAQITKRMARVTAKYKDKIQDRLNNEYAGIIILIMQRLHEADLAAYMASQGAAVVCLPSEFDPTHPHRYRHGSQWHPDAEKDPRFRFPYTVDGDWRTKEGELLNPLRFSPSVLAKKRAESPRGYAAKHQQRPTPTAGNQIKRHYFRRFTTDDPFQIASTADEVWITSDAAKKGGSGNDFHAIQVWARSGSTYTLLARVTERFGMPEYEAALNTLHEVWNPWRTGTLIEDTANGTTYLQYHADRLGWCVPFHPNETPGKDKSKAARAIYLERAAEANQIVLLHPAQAPWVEAWLDVVCAFPDGAHDDDVDAASQLLMRWELQARSGGSLTDWSF